MVFGTFLVLACHFLVMTATESLDYNKLKQKVLTPDSDISLGRIRGNFLPKFSILDSFDVEQEELRSSDSVDFTISAFGKDFHLAFERNKRLIPANCDVSWQNGKGEKKILDQSWKNCHFIHQNDRNVAALSDCSGKGKLAGFVSAENETFEIAPLSDDLKLLFLRDSEVMAGGFGIDLAEASLVDDLYLVTKAKSHKFASDEQELFPDSLFEEDFVQKLLRKFIAYSTSRMKPEETENASETFLELGVFVDQRVIGNLRQIHFDDENEMIISIFSVLNQASALFQHSSLKKKVSISISKLQIIEREDPFGEIPQEKLGERLTTLKSFCKYSNGKRNNKTSWDLGVLLTGQDLWEVDRWGDRDYATLGLTPIGAICHDKASCLEVEFTTLPHEDSFNGGDPYPTTGFAAAYILAHEIGHSLGMRHDGRGNNCDSNGYIMSPTREAGGETKWSQCSTESIQKLDKECLRNDPVTSLITAENDPPPTKEEQCQLFLGDKNAISVPEPDVCYSLKCVRRSDPSRIFSAGPPLDGTECGTSKVCVAGDCLSQEVDISGENSELHANFKSGSIGNDIRCTSGCLKKSLGFTRALFGKKLQHQQEVCLDQKICLGQRRISRPTFALKKCSQVYNKFTRGMPAIHSETDLTQSCRVFCQTRSKSWKGLENENGENVYFPDGTFCHRKNKRNYYCINHECLPHFD